MWRPDGSGDFARLRPGVPVRLAGTGVEVCWSGHGELVVYRRAGIWDLSPAVRPGRVLAWTRLVDRPQLGWWPLLPLATRTAYRGNSRSRCLGYWSYGRAAAHTRSNDSR